MVRFDVRPATDGKFIWRLLSGNNRTVAVAACKCDGRTECIAQLRRMCDIAVKRRPQLVHEDGGSWSWVLVDDVGVPVAQSSTSYPRRIDCTNAIDRFQELASAFKPTLIDDGVTWKARRRPDRGAGSRGRRADEP